VSRGLVYVYTPPPTRGARPPPRRLPGASLVTENGAGTHGIAFGDNDCVNRYVEAYLLDGKVPGERVYCAARPEPVADAHAQHKPKKK
ncbi:alpha/beta hydrolase, partial [Streptomyces celluloflavus]